jgi:hypothetical protein
MNYNPDKSALFNLAKQFTDTAFRGHAPGAPTEMSQQVSQEKQQKQKDLRILH